ncbi:MAG TPA: short-chain fatty acyl-CoA regulator family protein [Steroidobacteraceae bacterium]|nr:short-chain fatty acyl-CoA regulator family protein [Steroidobacteraceae bacterium]
MRDKLFLGPKVRTLREERRQTLDACAKQLGLSTSYLSQIETNQRPVTARVLIALSRYFGVDPGEFDTDDESRLIADLREATADLALDAASPGLPELKLAAATTPTLARQFLALHRAYRALDERMLRFDETVKIRTEDAPDSRIPYQEVRDFFHYRDNYVDELDVAAEAVAAGIGVGGDTDVVTIFERALADRFRIRVVRATSRDAGYIRRYDAAARVLSLGRDLAEPTRAFQLATQLGDLLFGSLFDQVLASAGLKSVAARDIARIGLGNYAAGALMMPYRQFAASAMTLRHDIEQLQHRYTASFEQVSHRLSTLQRPGARGVPFYFVRVDQAGNITKRHSSTRFQFARFGGACPLWNVHEAFGHPGRILVQLAEMPDGVRYLCVGRSIVKRSGNYLQPNRHYAIGIGCEVAHADKVVYSEGLRLDGAAVPVGVSCRICERPDCHQRAFPPLGRRLTVQPGVRRIVPYSIE